MAVEGEGFLQQGDDRCCIFQLTIVLAPLHSNLAPSHMTNGHSVTPPGFSIGHRSSPSAMAVPVGVGGWVRHQPPARRGATAHRAGAPTPHPSQPATRRGSTPGTGAGERLPLSRADQRCNVGVQRTVLRVGPRTVIIIQLKRDQQEISL